ncbi:hypothetical protein L6164_019458 [Bauhinia variegata]|uniref:Uncharacterized protein n=1 Tax=Bauhinia variegata TaxID=167791 RepID=A0ACB9MS62_BAUVA|nr:hypothetical protein L6164_019458 [Bauhinia variegata]
MGRARLPVKFIEKEKCRRATFNKRTKGLKKKCYELSTLCGVDAAMIAYGQESENAEPEIWPEDPRELRRIVERYQAKIAEQRPKIYDVTAFFKDRKNKVEAEIAKVQKRIREAMYPTWHDSFNNLAEESYRLFIDALDAKLEACKQRITHLKRIRHNLKENTPAESVANGSHRHFMLNIPQSQPALALADNNYQLPYYPPPQFDESSSSVMFHLDPNLLPKNNEMENHWSGFPTSYHNGMQLQNFNNYHPAAAEPALQKNIPSPNIQYEAANFPARASPLQGLQPNSFYCMLQDETLNYTNLNKWA